MTGTWKTLKVVSEKYQIPEDTLRRWAANRIITSCMVDKLLFIDEQSLLECLETGRKESRYDIFSSYKMLCRETECLKREKMSLVLHFKNLEALANTITRCPDMDIVILRDAIRLKQIPEKDKELLRMKTSELIHGSRLAGLFYHTNLFTVGDLLSFIKKHGWNSLSQFRNVGPKTVEMLQRKLMEMDILDEKLESRFFSYIIL